MEKRIYYYDTDAGGVVYYGHYLNYLEEARTEFLEKKGLSVAEFQARGFFYAVRKINVMYRSPARYGDILLCDASLTKISAAQLVFEQKIIQKSSTALVVEAEVSLVCLATNFKPAAIPDDLRAKLLK